MVVRARRSPAPSSRTAPAPWTFLTNHAHVLFCLTRDPECRMREVALAVGVTERAVQRIVGDLEAAGYLSHVRNGRRNHYELSAARPLRHPIEQHVLVSDLLRVLENPARVRPTRASVSRSRDAASRRRGTAAPRRAAAR